MIKKQSFIAGALALSISAIICKVLGAIYKIPLANILGSQGMGIYYIIFPIYAFILTFVSSNFTIAISRSVSHYVGEENYSLAHKTFISALYLLLMIGIVLSLLLCVFAKLIAHLQGLDSSFWCYLIISPAIIAVSIQSAFKGFFQGLKNMNPSAISQVIAQFTKIVIGFTLAGIFCKKSILFGTMGVFIGISVAEIITCLYFFIYYFIFRKKHFQIIEGSLSLHHISTLSLMKDVFKLAIPFTLSSVIFPMSLVIDSFLIINILKSMGFNNAFSTELLGLNSGIVNTLVNLPSTLSASICVTIIPFITYAISKKDYESVNSKIALAFKITILIALPCFFVFSFFSKGIIKLLFSYTLNSEYEINVASSLLTISSVNVLYLSLLQLTTALLQASNKAYIPVISLAVSLLFKVICELILINIPSFNISGAVISNAICFFISSCINIYYLRRNIPLNCSFTKTIITPFLSSVAMTLIIFLILNVFKLFSPLYISIIVAFIVGFISYIIFIFLLRTFTKEEQKSLFTFRREKVIKEKT